MSVLLNPLIQAESRDIESLTSLNDLDILDLRLLFSFLIQEISRDERRIQPASSGKKKDGIAAVSDPLEYDKCIILYVIETLSKFLSLINRLRVRDDMQDHPADGVIWSYFSIGS